MQDYYLGLDIGTNSVGWAVTDENYNLLRKKGKDLWGVRLFKEAQPATERRGHRSSRRRTIRKSLRKQLLRELFEEEINAIDKDFFLRLDESKYWLEDKKIEGKYSLFNDENFTDKDYYEKFPTIFHLRKALIESDDKEDIRLYFLAINQMMKRRGHFLIDGKLSNVEDITPFKECIQNLINEELDTEIETEFYDKAIKIVSDYSLKKTEKKNLIKDLVKETDSIEDSKKIINIFNLLISGKSKVNGIFDDEEILEKIKEDNKEDFYLTSEKYEENLEYFSQLLDYRFELISSLKSIYDYIILQEVLKGKKYLSYAQVERYKNHKEDLRKLKQLIKKYDKNGKIYYQIFRDENFKKGYVAYLGYYKKNKKNVPVKKCDYDTFSKNIKSTLDKICDKEDPLYIELIDKIEKGGFLLKQIVSTNSVIPHQVHELELDKILENLEKNYPSFKEISDGVSKIDKIKMIFNFRIPYYVGPLNDYHKDKVNSNTWIVKNEGFENENIRPWNFSKIVDEHACEEEFIKRMINECSYIPGEKVLPKSSLLYSEYMVLNELNNLRVNGDKLNPKIKKEIVENIYKKERKVTLKKIRNFLIINNYVDSKVEFSGLSDGIKANMSSYIDFAEILDDNFDNNMVEDLIEQITIHVGNVKLLTEKISNKYPNLEKKQINKIVNLKFKDWARFSRKLLVGIEGTEKETGEINTIIGFLRETNENFMELMSNRYTFSEEISEIKKKYIPNKLSKQIVDDLYVSPAVKKMIWQVLNINDELIKVLGKQPKKIFIEMARGKEEKPEVKDSRKNKLIELYKNLGKEGKEWLNRIEDKTEADFRNRALYLYYTQMGRCMYTGEIIDIERLYDKELYDLDHIIPRKMKKDDSIHKNLVLVTRNSNQYEKKDNYPVPEVIKSRENVRHLWYALKKKGLITEEKYNRLTRINPLSDKELSEFIERQLVETRQTTKVVKDLFENYYTDSKIVTVKAGLVSELRRDFEVLKCREINDLNHAHDAFLNIIVGDVWSKKFTSNPYNFVKKNREKYTLNNIFTKNQKDLRGNEIWNCAEGKKRIIKTLNKPSVLFSVENFEQTGQLFDQNIIGKQDYKEKTSYVPIKGDERLQDISKYGGYRGISGAYFFIVEHTEKNKRVKTIESLPIYMKSYVEENGLLDFCTNEMKLVDPKIIVKKLNYKSEIIVDGFKYLISGKTENRLSLETNEYLYWNHTQTTDIKKILNINEKIELEKYNGDIESERENIIKYIQIILEKFKLKPFIKRRNLPNIEINFADYETEKLLQLLVNLIPLTTKYVSPVDLTVISGSKYAGKVLIPKKISNLNEVIFISKSITGIYESRRRII
ncbi:CRISPR-associated protein cas9/csn1, subtype II/nmemi [Helcococcus kunzii ATCC 51366]|uniref:CRISPR-associated endonuclease Cas9 n=1 Tax=Helcococcus kunzii ATCC 51366 TaxID=883114 RepID=H3NQF8_9FIRM|nr:type II CRISPR RNA-guided endonuclease Cas9 [Helcococcus kunzii]EHR32288.1 CRISPR-associated protein cas9/csn1, subtype II/nmemi [Helcococcus kunzii ATCC 51366]